MPTHKILTCTALEILEMHSKLHETYLGHQMSPLSPLFNPPSCRKHNQPHFGHELCVERAPHLASVTLHPRLHSAEPMLHASCVYLAPPIARERGHVFSNHCRRRVSL